MKWFSGAGGGGGAEAGIERVDETWLAYCIHNVSIQTQDPFLLYAHLWTGHILPPFH